MSKYEAVPRLRALLSLIVLFLSFPLTLLFGIVALARDAGQESRRKAIGPDAPVVLLNGGKMSKSYMMARWFWHAGYKVVLVEIDKYWLSGARWSRAVTGFETVPCPRIDPKGYVDGLVHIADKYRARFFVPVSFEPRLFCE